MTEQRVMTKAELMAEIDQAWPRLNAALDRLTEAQMTTLTDAEGWSVKDHLVHLIFWERSVVFMLQGQPRHHGLGVDEALYLNGDDDEINAVIQRQHKDRPLADVLAQLRGTHEQLLQLLQPMGDGDLQKPCRHYLPVEPGEGDSPLAINLVYGNSADHFAEHLGWIETLVGQSPH